MHQHSKHRNNIIRSRSLPPVSLGSDTCTYETMQDKKADELIVRDRRVISDKSSNKVENKLAGPLGKVSWPMDNLGNTCFFNSVMQCLTHTLPLFQLCLSQSHTKQCQRSKDQCYQCRYIAFILEIAKRKQTNPMPIVRSLPAIWSGYRIGQQRDAHEFFTIYMEAILNSSFHEKPSRKHVINSQAKTPLFKIFGGKTRSQIRCERCDYRSDTHEETFTFNLPLPRSKECTFSEALESYFAVDKLRKDNKYMCPVCKSK